MRAQRLSWNNPKAGIAYSSRATKELKAAVGLLFTIPS